jgi:hypothetical protein
MTGNENIKIGDKLKCVANEGLSTIGSIKTIKGLTETSIDFCGAKTSWINRSEVRWGHYKHIPTA